MSLWLQKMARRERFAGHNAPQTWSTCQSVGTFQHGFLSSALESRLCLMEFEGKGAADEAVDTDSGSLSSRLTLHPPKQWTMASGSEATELTFIWCLRCKSAVSSSRFCSDTRGPSCPCLESFVVVDALGCFLLWFGWQGSGGHSFCHAPSHFEVPLMCCFRPPSLPHCFPL